MNNQQQYSRKLRFKTQILKRKVRKVIVNWNKLRTFSLVIGKFQVISKHIKLYGSNRPSQYPTPDDFPSHKQSNIWVLVPKSLFQSIWNIIITVALLYSTIILPYQLAFNEFIGDTWDYLDDISDIIYITDIIIHLNTATLMKNGKLSYSRKDIFVNYIKSWLIIDVLSSFPLKRFAQLIGQENKNSFNKFFRFLKINRVYRVSKLFKKLNSQKISLKASNIFQALVLILYCVLTLFLSIHILACFWYYISNFNEMKYNSWDDHFVYVNEEFDKVYLICIYYVFTTMTTVGYGDIVPVSNSEKLYSMFLMIYGATIYSFIVSGLINILNDKVRSKQILKEKLHVLKELREYSKIPSTLYKKIKSTLKVQAANTHPYKFDIYNHILEFPPSLKNEVFQSLFKSVINEITFLKSKPENFSFFIVPNLNLSIYLLNQNIYEENECSDEFYIIRKGLVHLDVLTILVRICVQGDYFGECELIEDCLRRTSATSCSKVSEIYSLSKKIFLNSLEEFPDVKKEIINVAKIRHQKSKDTKSLVQSTNSSGKEMASEHFEENAQPNLDMFRVDTGVAISLLRNSSAKQRNRTIWAKANGKEVFNKRFKEVTEDKMSSSFDFLNPSTSLIETKKRHASDGGVLKKFQG